MLSAIGRKTVRAVIAKTAVFFLLDRCLWWYAAWCVMVSLSRSCSFHLFTGEPYVFTLFSFILPDIFFLYLMFQGAFFLWGVTNIFFVSSSHNLRIFALWEERRRRTRVIVIENIFFLLRNLPSAFDPSHLGGSSEQGEHRTHTINNPPHCCSPPMCQSGAGTNVKREVKQWIWRLN